MGEERDYETEGKVLELFFALSKALRRQRSQALITCLIHLAGGEAR